MAIKPITPFEVVALKRKIIPDEVIQGFNEMIAEKWNGTYAEFTQKDVLDRIVAKMVRKQVRDNKRTGDSAAALRVEIFEKGWLDIDPVYKKAGWSVEYDKPGWGESGTATFKFSRNKRST